MTMKNKTLDERISAVLGANDFMMMDVHRPMTDEEINETHPQARLDKSARPFKVVERDAESVGSPHEEAPPKRCNFCFGPLPCEKHANVKLADVATSQPLKADRVLAAAHNQGLMDVVVVGVYEDGSLYFLASEPSIAVSMLMLEMAKARLLNVLQHRWINEDDEEREAPDEPA